MRTAAHTLVSVAATVLVHACVLQVVRLVLCGIEWLALWSSTTPYFYDASGYLLCYLSALITGLILGRVQGLYRPAITVPVGVIAFWLLILGTGAWPYGWWTSDAGNGVPWPLSHWAGVHGCQSLLVLLSVSVVGQFGVDRGYAAEHEAKWRLVLLVALNVALSLMLARWFFRPCLSHDEAEHLHVAWVMSQGVAPYRDIHQVHAPLLWMLTWPLMGWLPRNFEALLALRSLCAAALVGGYVAGLLMLREILGKLRVAHALILLSLVLFVAPGFSLWEYRPDPMMTLCAAWAILAAVRMHRAPARYSLLCGIALGLATAFSPRLSWLCLLVPLICLWECTRQRTLRPLWLAIPNAAGFIVGILPVAIWIVCHGALPRFWTWVVLGNSGHHFHNPFNAQLWNAVFVDPLFTAAILLGGLCLLREDWRNRARAWSPAHGVLVGALLAWCVPVIGTPVLILRYTYQLLAIPGAVLGTVLVARVLAWNVGTWQLRVAAVAIVFALVAASQKPPQDSESDGLGKAQFQELNRLCAGEKATCVCFAPWHPIFCRDAADLYLATDFLVTGWWEPSPVVRRVHRQLWLPALVEITQGKPTLIDPVFWDLAHRIGTIDDEQYDRFQQAVPSLYERVGRYALRKDSASESNMPDGELGR